MKKILHICSEYSNRPLYSRLVKKLNEKGFRQAVYVPVRRKSDIDRYKLEEALNVEFFYSFILNPLLRIFYFAKIRKVKNDILQKTDVDGYNLIHAHTLFTNGGPALKLKQITGIPYIVAIRNTDLNIFFKYFPHIRSFGISIMENAEAIVFISSSWKGKLKEVLPSEKWTKIRAKCITIPNAVDDFWQQNRKEEAEKLPGGKIKLVYAGRFIKRKGLQNLISALDILNHEETKYELTLIGGGGNYDKIINQMANERDYISIKTHKPKTELIDEFRNADIFTMPSRAETFGLVYIEAMTQGLPVLYSRNEGIDTMFEDGEVGFAARHDNPRDIADKLKRIEKNYGQLSQNALEISRDFNWQNISEKYTELYSSVSNSALHV